MNLLLFSVIDFPNGSAGSSYAALIVKGLRENGENVSLVTPHATLLGNRSGNTRSYGHVGGVPYLYLNGRVTRAKGAAKAAVESFSGMFNGSRMIFRRLRRKRLEAVILVTPDSLEYAPIILTCIICRIPIVLWMMERITLTNDDPGWRQKLRLLGFAMTESLLPRVSDGCIAISRSLRAHLLDLVPPQKVLLSPIVVDPAWKCHGPQLKSIGLERLILYSGTFDEKDGIDYMIDAFNRTRERHPEARLVMTGESPSNKRMNYVHQLVTSRGIDAYVTFAGFVSRAALEQLQASADVLLVCRTKSAFARNGFPWKLGEYCVTGKPVVATRVGDIEDYFQDRIHMFFADPEDAESIANQIVFVLENYTKALAAAQRCRVAAIEKLNYSTEMARVAGFLRARIMGPGLQIVLSNEHQL
jgi:glycosyltransferase involved in cell wall biosynthesis